MARDHSGPGEGPAPAAAAGAGRRRRHAVADRIGETRTTWRSLSVYERFEQVVALVLTVLVSLVILAAMINLTVRIGMLVALGLVDPANQEVLHVIFGMILTVLIALEFNHSILGVLQRSRGVVEVRTVVLIALLALVRKFIILDATKVAPSTLFALAVAILALGVVHWLVRDQDRRESADEEAAVADGDG